MLKSLLPTVYQVGTSYKREDIALFQRGFWNHYLQHKTDQDYLSLYINVPFCTQKCKYCEYPSKVCKSIDDRFLDKLEAEFKVVSSVLGEEPIPTVMFGGGSPSLLSPSQLTYIFNMIDHYWNIDLSVDGERGFEVQPHHITPEHIRVLENSFINRISMGVQSFDRDVIKAENRYYSSKDDITFLYTQFKKFAKIVNTDLLAGLYNQTTDILLRDIEALLEIGVESLTIYELNETRKHSADKEAIKAMLRAIPNIGVPEPYRYVGTTNDEFMHCNRFYKPVEFDFPYNPAPQGYNNIVSFSLHDSVYFSQHAWSLSHPTKMAYEMKGKSLVTYSMEDIAKIDRTFWAQALQRRDA